MALCPPHSLARQKKICVIRKGAMECDWVCWGCPLCEDLPVQGLHTFYACFWGYMFSSESLLPATEMQETRGRISPVGTRVLQ